MTDLDALKNKIAGEENDTEDTQGMSEVSEKTEEDTSVTEPVQEQEEEVAPKPADPVIYTTYNCARPSMKFITPNGKTIVFSNYKLITKDKDVIAYMNEIIEQGIRTVTAGGEMTSEDLDPTAALRRKYYKEFMEEQAAKAGPGPRDFGATEGASSAKILTSNQAI